MSSEIRVVAIVQGKPGTADAIEQALLRFIRRIATSTAPINLSSSNVGRAAKRSPSTNALSTLSNWFEN
jgi:hypothetical protein